MRKTTLELIDRKAQLKVCLPPKGARSPCVYMEVGGLPCVLASHLQDNYGGHVELYRQDEKLLTWTAGGNTAINFLVLYKDFLPSLFPKIALILKADWTPGNQGKRLTSTQLEGRWNAFVQCNTIDGWRI